MNDNLTADDMTALLAQGMNTDDLDACDPLPEAEVGAQASEGIRYVNMPEVFAPRGYTDIEEAEVGAQPPIESTEPPESDALVTAADIRAAYRELYATTGKLMYAKHSLQVEEYTLIREGADAAGKNADQRAAILYGLMADEHREVDAAEINAALARIKVDELRTLLRLAEWEQRADELILSGGFAERD